MAFCSAANKRHRPINSKAVRGGNCTPADAFNAAACEWVESLLSNQINALLSRDSSLITPPPPVAGAE